MQVTYIPTGSPVAGDPGVKPENLAAILARYSRSNEGIETLLQRHAHQSPDRIMKFADYGHASIGGLTGGIALAVDGVTMYLATKLFEFAQMADGQESSTRYIPMSTENLPSASAIGIPEPLAGEWREVCTEGFELYELARTLLEEQIAKSPELLRLPPEAQGNEKLRERLTLNYGLDRARYFLPLALKTNVAIVATARIWADIIKLVDSLGVFESDELAAKLRAELELAAPNFVRHSYYDTASCDFVQEPLRAGVDSSLWAGGSGVHEHLQQTARCGCNLEVFDLRTGTMSHGKTRDRRGALADRANRYSHAGVAIKRQTVACAWSAIAIAEYRDLNRHRTGFRWSDWGARGFYLPSETRALLELHAPSSLQYFLSKYSKLLRELMEPSQDLAQASVPYAFFLGTQIPFEHTQQADKFLYEVELRTGLGAHFRYAEHLRQAAELYFAEVPEARPFIKLGQAEPEV